MKKKPTKFKPSSKRQPIVSQAPQQRRPPRPRAFGDRLAGRETAESAKETALLEQVPPAQHIPVEFVQKESPRSPKGPEPPVSTQQIIDIGQEAKSKGFVASADPAGLPPAQVDAMNLSGYGRRDSTGKAATTEAERKRLRDKRKNREQQIYDPKVEEHPDDQAPRFQIYVFDPKLGGRKSSKMLNTPLSSLQRKQAAGKISTATKTAPSELDRVFGGRSGGETGISVTTEGSDNPRESTPWWILKDDAYRKFLMQISTWRPRTKMDLNELNDAELCQVAGLDDTILREFYLYRFEDADIFQQHKEEFLTEIDRQRRTPSVKAVAKRRERLVKLGNEICGIHPPPGSDAAQDFYAGVRFTPPYATWLRIKSLCENSDDPDYEDYGGADTPVLLCDRWQDFRNFFADVQGRQPEGTVLSRRNGLGDFEPDNVVWRFATNPAPRP